MCDIITRIGKGSDNMLLAVNVGNRETTVGFFEGKRLCFSAGICTSEKSGHEFAIAIKSIIELNGYTPNEIDRVILSSVVPQITGTVKYAVSLLCNAEITEIAPGIKTGFSIKIDDPSQLGSDIVANTSAAIKHVGYPCIVVDVGNSTTVFAVNSKKELVGGCIFPGVYSSFNSLYSSTAQLPNISMKAPCKAIGKNSADSMRSGVIFGTAMAIDGFINKFKSELGVDDSMNLGIVATGNFAPQILSCCSNKIIYKKDLTLEGLCNIMELNKKATAK
jgi:type III pantothenate kinase